MEDLAGAPDLKFEEEDDVGAASDDADADGVAELFFAEPAAGAAGAADLAAPPPLDREGPPLFLALELEAGVEAEAEAEEEEAPVLHVDEASAILLSCWTADC